LQNLAPRDGRGLKFFGVHAIGNAFGPPSKSSSALNSLATDTTFLLWSILHCSFPGVSDPGCHAPITFRIELFAYTESLRRTSRFGDAN
jgi:hypothetical protein